MATNVDYQQATDRARDLLIEATKLHTLIDQNSPANPQQFGAAITHIDQIQKHLNNLRTPIQHLSLQSNIPWATDNITTSGFGWVEFFVGLVVGILAVFVFY